MPDDRSSERSKKDRSPSFPFVSLKKAVERASALNDAHRREPARLSIIGHTWGYAPRSSGLLQTVAALKQFGLVEDAGSGDDRKAVLTDLGRRILLDTRHGAREQAIEEAARRPRLLSEYYSKWLPERPNDPHCISELHLDRGFSQEAARTFLRVFDETVSFAKLADSGVGDQQGNENGSSNPSSGDIEMVHEPDQVLLPILKSSGPRLQLVVGERELSVNAVLRSQSEVDRLIRMLEANRPLLDNAD